MTTHKAVMRVASFCLKVIIFIVIVLGIVSLGLTTYRYTHAVFSDAALEEEPGKLVRVKIPEDVNGKQLAKVLEENGLIEDANVFVIQMKMADFGETVKAGTYELSTSMPPSEMFKILSSNGDET